MRKKQHRKGNLGQKFPSFLVWLIVFRTSSGGKFRAREISVSKRLWGGKQSIFLSKFSTFSLFPALKVKGMIKCRKFFLFFFVLRVEGKLKFMHACPNRTGHWKFLQLSPPCRLRYEVASVWDFFSSASSSPVQLKLSIEFPRLENIKN